MLTFPEKGCLRKNHDDDYKRPYTNNQDVRNNQTKFINIKNIKFIALME